MNLIIQGLKIFCIVQILLSSGTGFLKVTELANEVGSVFDTLAQTEFSFADISWIPLLALQLLTTVFNVLQFYFMIRELFENNYMNKHCYKTAYTLTLLIYLLSVFPKTIVNLVSNREKTTLDDLSGKLLDFFDGLLSALQALTFQIVLFQDVVIAALQKCGICKGKGGETVDGEEDLEKDEELSEFCGCCIKFLVRGEDIDDPENQSKIRFKIARGIRGVGEYYKKGAGLSEATNKKTTEHVDKIDSTKNDLVHEILIDDSANNDGILEDVDKEHLDEDSKKSTLIGKGIKGHGGFYKKGVTLSDSVMKKAEELEHKLDARRRSLVNTIPTPAISAKVKGSQVAPAEGLELGSTWQECRRLKTPRDGSREATSQLAGPGCDDTAIDIEHGSDLPDPCGGLTAAELDSATDTNDEEMANGCPVKCPAPCRRASDKCCACYNNRKLSFIVTLSMANTHLLVYVVEIVLVFCIPC